MREKPTLPAIRKASDEVRELALDFAQPASMGQQIFAALQAAGQMDRRGGGRRQQPLRDHERRNMFNSCAGDILDGVVRPARAPAYAAEWASFRIDDVQRVTRQRPPAAAKERFTAVIETVVVTTPEEGTLAAYLLNGVSTWADFIDRLQPRLAWLAAEFGGVRNRPAGWGDDLRVTFHHGPHPRIAFSNVPAIGDGWRVWFEPAQSPLLAPSPDDEPGVQRTTTFTAKAILAMVAMAADSMLPENAKAATGAPPPAAALGLEPEPTQRASDVVQEQLHRIDAPRDHARAAAPLTSTRLTMRETTDVPPWVGDLKGEVEKLIAKLSSADGATRPQPLTELAGALNEKFGAGVTYRPLYERVINGAVPQVFRLRNRWYWWPEDLDAIAGALGIRDGEGLSDAA